MIDLNKTIERFERRRKRFMQEGLSEDQAYDLADMLFERDGNEFDDRRLCFECQHYQDSTKLCAKLSEPMKPYHPTRFTLQRCPEFVLREVK